MARLSANRSGQILTPEPRLLASQGTRGLVHASAQSLRGPFREQWCFVGMRSQDS